MRGLRLFIRPIEPGDRGAIEAFLAAAPARQSTSRRVDESTSAPGPAMPNRAFEEPASLSSDETGASRLLVDWRMGGLLAKLLGDIVAVAFVEEERDVLKVRLLLVAETFRKKWIGRTMLGEIEQLAGKLDKHSLVVDIGDAAGAEEFLRRTGFHGEGERWVRVVP